MDPNTELLFSPLLKHKKHYSEQDKMWYTFSSDSDYRVYHYEPCTKTTTLLHTKTVPVSNKPCRQSSTTTTTSTTQPSKQQQQQQQQQSTRRPPCDTVEICNVSIDASEAASSSSASCTTQSPPSSPFRPFLLRERWTAKEQRLEQVAEQAPVQQYDSPILLLLEQSLDLLTRPSVAAANLCLNVVLVSVALYLHACLAV